MTANALPEHRAVPWDATVPAACDVERTAVVAAPLRRPAPWHRGTAGGAFAVHAAGRSSPAASSSAIATA